MEEEDAKPTNSLLDKLCSQIEMFAVGVSVGMVKESVELICAKQAPGWRIQISFAPSSGEGEGWAKKAFAERGRKIRAGVNHR